MSWQTMGAVAISTWLFIGAQTITVAAPSSFTDVLPKLIEAYHKDNAEPDFKTSIDATSRLAKQLEQGAAFDLFISADEAWAAKAKLVQPRVIASGHLVVVVPVDQTTPPRTLQDLAAHPPRKLALAGENVPAGRYAEASLKAAGVWDTLKPTIVRADNVRGALKWVAKGEADAAIVYMSDTLNEPRVKLAIGIDSSLHPPIHYVAGLVEASKQRALAQRFLDFLESDSARAILVQSGFSRP